MYRKILLIVSLICYANLNVFGQEFTKEIAENILKDRSVAYLQDFNKEQGGARLTSSEYKKGYYAASYEKVLNKLRDGGWITYDKYSRKAKDYYQIIYKCELTSQSDQFITDQNASKARVIVCNRVFNKIEDIYQSGDSYIVRFESKVLTTPWGMIIPVNINLNKYPQTHQCYFRLKNGSWELAAEGDKFSTSRWRTQEYHKKIRDDNAKKREELNKGKQQVDVQAKQSPHSNLLFITHGFNSNVDGWVNQLKTLFVKNLTERSELESWDIVAYDWKDSAVHAKTDAADLQGVIERARESGIVLGSAYAKRHYTKVHLIAHSAGTWLINEIARKINTEDCFVQVTFLDAYVPLNKIDDNDLGKYADFSEQYFDGHFKVTEEKTWLGETGRDLKYCFNYNVSSSNPNDSTISFMPWKTYVTDHAWPCQWYIQSIGSKRGLDLSIVLGHKPDHTGLFSRTGDVENQVSKPSSNTKQKKKSLVGELLKILIK